MVNSNNGRGGNFESQRNTNANEFQRNLVARNQALFVKLVSPLKLVYIIVEHIYQVIYLSTLLIFIELKMKLLGIKMQIINLIFPR